MKYRGIFEYEYPTEHKPPVSIDVHLHGDCVKGKIIEWEYRPLEQEPQSFKWCETCKEYDQEKHCCHRWSKVIRDTVEEMKQEQEPRKGHWFIDERPESNRETICSNCEQPIFKYHKLDFDYRPSFCPNCGAKMVETQESEG